MTVFHVFKIVQVVPNRAKHLILLLLPDNRKRDRLYSIVCYWKFDEPFSFRQAHLAFKIIYWRWNTDIDTKMEPFLGKKFPKVNEIMFS